MWVFFLVVHVLICISMIGLILLQRSEGGGFVSGNPTGLISARGRADLLTRLTSILATGFFVNSIVLAILAGGYNKAGKILDPLSEKVDVPLAVSPEKNLSVETSRSPLKEESSSFPEPAEEKPSKHAPSSKKTHHSKK